MNLKKETYKMKRRELLKNTSLWVSGLLLTPSVVVLKSCNPLKREDKWKSDFFSSDNGNLIFELIDTLIPNTEIPGAIEAKVHEFVESYVRDVYNKNKREWFIEELSNFNDKIKKFSSKSFFKLNIIEKINTLNEIQKKESGNSASFYIDLKKLVIRGYFNSEIGVTQALNYRPIPGTFKGCIPLSESGGKLWS
tara:strand:- start:1995 stop:2576 length:582 start_codon:yes stop_codon:yes gene_type:complete